MAAPVEYSLDLLSNLPNSNIKYAEFGKIYLSPKDNTYFILDTDNRPQKGSLEGINLKTLSDPLEDKNLKKRILKITEKAGYTSSTKKLTAWEIFVYSVQLLWGSVFAPLSNIVELGQGVYWFFKKPKGQYLLENDMSPPLRSQYRRQNLASNIGDLILDNRGQDGQARAFRFSFGLARVGGLILTAICILGFLGALAAPIPGLAPLYTLSIAAVAKACGVTIVSTIAGRAMGSFLGSIIDSFFSKPIFAKAAEAGSPVTTKKEFIIKATLVIALVGKQTKPLRELTNISLTTAQIIKPNPSSVIRESGPKPAIRLSAHVSSPPENSRNTSVASTASSYVSINRSFQDNNNLQPVEDILSDPQSERRTPSPHTDDDASSKAPVSSSPRDEDFLSSDEMANPSPRPHSDSESSTASDFTAVRMEEDAFVDTNDNDDQEAEYQPQLATIPEETEEESQATAQKQDYLNVPKAPSTGYLYKKLTGEWQLPLDTGSEDSMERRQTQLSPNLKSSGK